MISNFFSTMLLCNLKLRVQSSESSQSDCSIYVHSVAEFFCSLTSNTCCGITLIKSTIYRRNEEDRNTSNPTSD